MERMVFKTKAQQHCKRAGITSGRKRAAAECKAAVSGESPSSLARDEVDLH